MTKPKIAIHLAIDHSPPVIAWEGDSLVIHHDINISDIRYIDGRKETRCPLCRRPLPKGSK